MSIVINSKVTYHNKALGAEIMTFCSICVIITLPFFTYSWFAPWWDKCGLCTLGWGWSISHLTETHELISWQGGAVQWWVCTGPKHGRGQEKDVEWKDKCQYNFRLQKFRLIARRKFVQRSQHLFHHPGVHLWKLLEGDSRDQGCTHWEVTLSFPHQEPSENSLCFLLGFMT